MEAAYQLAFEGDSVPAWEQALGESVREQLQRLGLQPASKYLRLAARDASIDQRMPACVVFCAAGGGAPASPRLIDALRLGLAVFPVVAEGVVFSDAVPDELHHLNGFVWADRHDELSAALVAALGLASEQRSAFISYRRADSRAVAVQLYHALSDRGYGVFLDTASLRPGADFQIGLAHRMLDADLLVFLDTPAALSSHWVEHELTQAHNHGMGVLQLVWPGHDPYDGTELSVRYRLAEAHFTDGATPTDETGAANPEAQLAGDVLGEISDAAETVRMRSLASRRARVVGEIVAAARHHGLDAVPAPVGPVTLVRNDQEVATAVPVVGSPGSTELYAARELFEGARVRLVYDGLGIRPDRRSYLEWLNQELAKYQSVSIDELPEWLSHVP